MVKLLSVLRPNIGQGNVRGRGGRGLPMGGVSARGGEGSARGGVSARWGGVCLGGVCLGGCLPGGCLPGWGEGRGSAQGLVSGQRYLRPIDRSISQSTRDKCI